MTEHSHTTTVAGCFRCDLNRDEVAAALAESVQDALAAMDTAEQEAHDHLDGDDPQDVEYGEWAADRLRLIERDKATLERHTDHEYEGGLHTSGARVTYVKSHKCGDGNRPCEAARAVIDYWENA